VARTFPREGSGRRRGPYRQPARTMLVVCGGQETERQYFQGLRDHVRNPAVSVVVRPKVGSPRQLVTYAKKLRDQNRDSYDEVWCVFDVDEFTDVAEAAATARSLGIKVAVSNPCFELWLLLHFAEHRAYVSTYKKLLPLLEKHVPGYSKSLLDFVLYREAYERAGERARKLDPSGQEHALNPSTSVWRLTQGITVR
jgi:hypothetical protein